MVTGLRLRQHHLLHLWCLLRPPLLPPFSHPSIGLIIFSVGMDVISYATIKVYDHEKNESYNTLAFGAFYAGLVTLGVAGYGYYVIWNLRELTLSETKRTQTHRILFWLHILSGVVSVIGIIIDGVVGYGQEQLGYFEVCANDEGRVWKDGIIGDDWIFGVDDSEVYEDCLIPRNTSDCYCSYSSKCWEFKATSTRAFSSSDCSVFLNGHEYPSRISTTFSFCILVIPMVFVCLIPCSFKILKEDDQADALVATFIRASFTQTDQSAPPLIVAIPIEEGNTPQTTTKTSDIK